MSSFDSHTADSTPRGLRLNLEGEHPLPPEDVSASPEDLRRRLGVANAVLHRVRTLGEIAVQIDAARGRDEILNVLRSETRWLLPFDVAFAALVNRGRTHYQLLALSPIAEATDVHLRHFPLNQGMPGTVIVNQTPMSMAVTPGPLFSSGVEGVLAGLGMQSLLMVPLRAGTDTVGALITASADPGVYGEPELWIAQLLGVQAATALRNASIFDDAQKRLSQIELVNEIAGTLSSTLEPEQLLTEAAELVRSTFQYFDVSIFFVDRKADEAVLAAHAGSYADFLPRTYRQRLSEGIVGWVARSGERCMVNDVTEDPRYLAYEYHSTKSELALPIRVDRETVGVLNVEDTRLHAFDETDAIVLETLCDQLGGAIRNARLYDEVRRANTKLTELDRMKSDFLGIVSHDFRSPLASIVLAARALMKRGDAIDPQRLTEYLTIIVDQANRLSNLAEDTLSITKMESGQLNYFFKVVNVERLIKDAAALVGFSRRHTFRAHVDPNVAYIKGDQSKLRQVVQNLLSNAVKYSPRGGQVVVEACEHDAQHLRISVTDEGIGIPGDQMGRLFQKFSRIDTAEAREIKGSGLGLWICREIVAAHGGDIWVESTPGEGSTFRFTIRKAQPEADPPDAS
jgi:signal transduction histidine kinase